jgi:predicted regulator of Ras-like GTPase activity (Roadblock/LC7/MglB family)
MQLPIPEGTPIGEIEASLEWLLSHTARFMGAIVVRIYPGEGFILVRYGQPVGFAFRMGDRVLRGAGAWQFFEKKDFLNASLHRYTDTEFQQALALAGPETQVPGGRREVHGPAENRVPWPITADSGILFGKDRQGAAGPATERVSAPVFISPDFADGEPFAGSGSRTEPAPSIPIPIAFEERIPEDILDRVFRTPGVTAAAIFRERSIVDFRGEISLEELVETAEDILLTAGEILSLLSTGPLGQVTLRVSGTNVTIAPFEDGYLLILTGPEVNLGQIRKLVHDGACAGKG